MTVDTCSVFQENITKKKKVAQTNDLFFFLGLWEFLDKTDELMPQDVKTEQSAG